MKKILRYSLVCMLLLMSGSAFAQNEVKIDFDNDYQTLFPTIPGVSSGNSATYVADGEFNETTTSTAVDGCTVTVEASDAESTGARNRIWASSPRLRMYDKTLTITAPKKFKKLTMNVKTNAGNIAGNNTVDTGTLDVSGLNGSNNGVLVWTGNASEVVMTIAGNTQFKNIIISYDGGGSEPTVIDATVAQALDVINGLTDGAETTDKYKVTGYVVGTPDFQRYASGDKEGQLYGNVNLTIADEKGGTALLTIYRAKGLNNQNFTEEDVAAPIFKEGDQVVFQGTLQKFVRDGVTTPELKNGYLVSVTAGIHAATIDNDPNAPMYNLKGERVDNSYRGVVIQNGKKFVIK